jgi:hypothetical protein
MLSVDRNNKFYACPRFYLLVYETREAASCGEHMTVGDITPTTATNYLSTKTNSKVTYSKPGEPIFKIKEDGKYWNVIIGEKVGWIIVASWLEIKELINDQRQ